MANLKDYSQHGAIVARVMEELGYPNRKTDQDGKETGSFRVTLAAAQVIHQTIDPDFGILEKPSGNNVDGYSVDCLFDRSNGRLFDVITSSGGPNSGPGWGDAGYADLSRWRNPMDLPLVLGPSGPAQPPVVTPPGGDSDRIGELLAQLAELRGACAAIAGESAKIAANVATLAAALGPLAQAGPLALAGRQEELADLTSERINAQADRLMAAIGKIKPFSLFGSK